MSEGKSPNESIDFGDATGMIDVTILGTTFQVCPSDELDEIGEKCGVGTDKVLEGAAFIKAVRDHLTEKIGQQVTGSIAAGYYAALRERDRRLSDFISTTLGLRSTTDSTPGSSPAAAAADS